MAGICYNVRMLDLHLHLDGSLTREELAFLAEMSGKDPKEAFKARISVDASCHSLNDYLECFEYPISVLQNEKTIAKAVYFLISRLSKDGLLYAEIRFAPQLHLRNGLTQSQVVAAAIAGLEEAKKEFLFPAKLILCAMRGDNNEAQNLETVRVAKEYLNKGVAAVDLAGAEALFPTNKHASAFRLCNELGVPFTCHAGEAAGPDSIWDAVKMGASRIGHGVRCVEDPLLVSFLANAGIPLELCPTSEVDTHAIPAYDALPLRKLMSSGVKVTINTDDMTVSNISLREEFAKAKEAFGLSDEEVKALIVNAIEAAYLEADQKAFLRARLEKAYERSGN